MDESCNRKLTRDQIEGLYRTHSASLLKYASAILRDSCEAQEAVDDVFVRLFKRSCNVELSVDPADLTAMERLLKSFVKLSCIDVIRRRQRERRANDGPPCGKRSKSGASGPWPETDEDLIRRLHDEWRKEQRVVSLNDAANISPIDRTQPDPFREACDTDRERWLGEQHARLVVRVHGEISDKKRQVWLLKLTGVPQHQIAEELDMYPSQVTQILDELEARLLRCIDEVDGESEKCA